MPASSMPVLEALLRDYLLPLAVLASSASASATLAFVWKVHTTMKEHDRALYGEAEIEGHDGIVRAVNENTQMTDHHDRVLRRHDLIEAPVRPPSREGGRRDHADPPPNESRPSDY